MQSVQFSGSKETHMHTRLTALTPQALSILRIVSGYLLLLHGTAKLLGLPFIQIFAQFEPSSLAGAAAVIELVCGTLLLVGLLTRAAAILASGLCASAYFIGHVALAGSPFFPLLNGGESSVLFCFVFLYIFFAGPGPWSLDAMKHVE
jgi:Predicted membrane protein